MGLKPRFTKADIRAEFKRKLEALNKARITILSFLGEMCVNQARSVNTYQDQTGNLRNSIGYVILVNGVVVKSNFGKSASVGVTGISGSSVKTKGSQSGVVVGRAHAMQLAKEYPTGYVLIVVAGMNYAVSVEARGLDVLTSAEQLAKSELPRMLRDLKADMAALQ